MAQHGKGRRYDAEFKRAAVALVLDQGMSINKVSQDLGVGYDTLKSWVKEYQQASDPVQGLSLQEENRHLKRELEQMRMERDVLKKAVGIFSQHPK